MKKGQEIVAKYPDLLIIHQKFPGKEIGYHSHDEHEFIIPLQGSIRIFDDAFDLKCGAGKLVYMPPKIGHHFSSSASGEGERIVLLITSKKWNKSCSKKFSPSQLPFNSLARELIFYLLLNPKSKFVKSFSTALIENLIEGLSNFEENLLIQEKSILSKITDERIKQALELIDDDIEINVSELAKKCGLSPRNMNKLFLKEVGSSPKNLMVQKKILKAKELLKTTNMTVTDIGLEVGYNSLSKFIQNFQKFTGVLPSSYKKSPS